jgi:FtsH-binding integral membrane protein
MSNAIEDNSSCFASALGLVAVQLALCSGAAYAGSNVEFQARMSQPQATFLSMALMILGIVLVDVVPWAAWLAFTAGVAVVTSEYGRDAPETLRDTLLLSCAMIGVAALCGPWILASLGKSVHGVLLSGALLLIVLLLVLVIWPSDELRLATSILGGLLFALWTVNDVALQKCTNPFTKSITVFLDLLNVFAYARLAFDK